MDRPEASGSLKVVSMSERATGALGAVGGGFVAVAVGGRRRLSGTGQRCQDRQRGN